jgi:methyl-accepting chemotaxis protein
MNFIRRILGIIVMIAGVLGLVISLSGLIAVWMLKPTVAGSVKTTIQTLNTSIDTSQQVMVVTGEALGATVDSVDALSTMLSTTAVSMEDTQPVLDELNVMLGETVPSTLESATESIKTAQQAAVVLDSAIKSLDTFRAVLSAVPLVGGFVERPTQAYNPQVPLADSLGDLATTLEDLPATFTEMAENLDKADDNMVTIQSNLTTMSTSVARISTSLGEYQAMISQSQSSMGSMKSMLTNVENNLDQILNWGALILSVLFFWLLVAQVVILSQGWELYQGTAGRMEGGAAEPPAVEPATES